MTSFRHLAALGSSFAAGPTIDPVADPAAMRSARNYPSQVAHDLGARLTDLTVSGATTATILRESQITMLGSRFPPQVEGIPEEADLVTITAGGNDLQLIGSMMYHALARVEPMNPVTTMMAPDFPSGIPDVDDQRVRTVATGLCDIVDSARRRAPGARVLLVDYLRVIPADPALVSTWFTGDQVDALRRLQDALERAYVLAAERTGADLITASAASESHTVNSSEPWVNGLQTDLAVIGGSFHPNLAGMTAVATEIVHHLES